LDTTSGAFALDPSASSTAASTDRSARITVAACVFRQEARLTGYGRSSDLTDPSLTENAARLRDELHNTLSPDEYVSVFERLVAERQRA
jgi:hypothetical protein